jgi:hypothetical protein
MKNNMKNKWLIGGAVAAFIAFSANVQAIPSITGSINFENGTATLNATDPSAATAILSFGGTTIVNPALGVAPTGSYLGLGSTAVTGGEIGTGVGGFTFSPSLSPTPINPLWSFVVGGITYDFILQTVTSSIGAGDTLDLGGTGLLQITGFQDTQGTWSFSTAGSGPTTFGFTAGNAAVPDGGTTVLLLGAALSGLGLLRKKLTA